MKITKDDFFKATKADWTFKKEMKGNSVLKFRETADFVSDSGSSYKYTQRGVYRVSNHFTHNVASCDWTMDGEEHEFIIVMAYCSWKDFERITSTCCGYDGYWYRHDFYPFNGNREYVARLFLETVLQA